MDPCIEAFSIFETECIILQMNSNESCIIHNLILLLKVLPCFMSISISKSGADGFFNDPKSNFILTCMHEVAVCLGVLVHILGLCWSFWFQDLNVSFRCHHGQEHFGLFVPVFAFTAELDHSDCLNNLTCSCHGLQGLCLMKHFKMYWEVPISTKF